MDDELDIIDGTNCNEEEDDDDDDDDDVEEDKDEDILDNIIGNDVIAIKDTNNVSMITLKRLVCTKSAISRLQDIGKTIHNDMNNNIIRLIYIVSIAIA
jgi:hypothetical protein